MFDRIDRERLELIEKEVCQIRENQAKQLQLLQTVLQYARGPLHAKLILGTPVDQ